MSFVALIHPVRLKQLSEGSLGEQIFRRWSERSQVDTFNRCFVLFQSREATQDSAEQPLG